MTTPARARELVERVRRLAALGWNPPILDEIAAALIESTLAPEEGAVDWRDYVKPPLSDTERELAKNAMTEMWPEFGGNNQSVEFWYGADAALQYLIRHPRHPDPRVRVLREAINKWAKLRTAFQERPDNNQWHGLADLADAERELAALAGDTDA